MCLLKIQSINKLRKKVEMIVIAGSFRFADGVTDEVTAACKTVMQATHLEEGCHEYIFYPDPLDSDVLRVFEMWENDQALTNHFGTTHVDAFRKAMGGWTISDREIKKFETDSFESM